MTLKTTFRSKLLAALLVWGLAAGAAHATSAAAPADAAPAPSAAQQPVISNASDPAHIALAKAYVDNAGMEEDIRAAVEEMSQRISADQRVLFRSLAEKSIDFAKLKSAATIQVANMFTDEEIKAMTKFFSSPEGRAIRKKLPAYETSMQPVVYEVMQGFAMKLKENNIAVAQ